MKSIGCHIFFLGILMHPLKFVLHTPGLRLTIPQDIELFYLMMIYGSSDFLPLTSDFASSPYQSPVLSMDSAWIMHGWA